MNIKIDPNRFKNVPFLYPTVDVLFQVSFDRAKGDPLKDPETNIHKYGCRFMCEMAMCQYISGRAFTKEGILQIYHDCVNGRVAPNTLTYNCVVGGNEHIMMKYALEKLGNTRHSIRQVMVKSVNARDEHGNKLGDWDIHKYKQYGLPGPGNPYFVIVDFNTRSSKDYGGHHFVLFNAIGELIYDPENGNCHTYSSVNKLLFYKVFGEK